MSENPRERIVERASREIQDGTVVNLGIGLPTALAERRWGIAM